MPTTDTACTNLDDLPLVLTVPELGKVLRLGKDSTYALVNSGAIRSRRSGRNIRIPRSAVEEYLGGGRRG